MRFANDDACMRCRARSELGARSTFSLSGSVTPVGSEATGAHADAAYVALAARRTAMTCATRTKNAANALVSGYLLDVVCPRIKPVGPDRRRPIICPRLALSFRALRISDQWIGAKALASGPETDFSSALAREWLSLRIVSAEQRPLANVVFSCVKEAVWQ